MKPLVSFAGRAGNVREIFRESGTVFLACTPPLAAAQENLSFSVSPFLSVYVIARVREERPSNYSWASVKLAGPGI